MEVPVAATPLPPAHAVGPETVVYTDAVGPFFDQVQVIGPPSASRTVAVVVMDTLRDTYVDTGTSGGMSISGTVLIA